MPTIQE